MSPADKAYATQSVARSLLHWPTLRGRIDHGRRPPRLSRPGFGPAVRPFVAVLMLAGLLFGGSEQVASAPNEQDLPNASSVRMDVRAGFDGSGRVGGWVPLDVNLVNEGSELNANVQVVIDQPGGRSTYS